jgi:hypothetical protein
MTEKYEPKEPLMNEYMEDALSAKYRANTRLRARFLFIPTNLPTIIFRDGAADLTASCLSGFASAY